MALKTDYKDDIPKTENRRYQMINNSDGTVSFVDVTEYTQVGDTFGAGDINATNESVNGKVEITDIVDPALVTQEGFAADALKTKQGFDELNSKLRYNEETDMIEIYYNGIWNEWKHIGFQSLRLYYYGDENAELTGGWTPYAYVYTGVATSKRAPSKTVQSNCMKLSQTSTTAVRNIGSVFANNVIDFSKFNKLKINVNSVIVKNGKAELIVTKTKISEYTYTRSISFITDGEYVMDISDLSGDYYVAFVVNTADGASTSYCVESVELL